MPARAASSPCYKITRMSGEEERMPRRISKLTIITSRNTPDFPVGLQGLALRLLRRRRRVSVKTGFRGIVQFKISNTLPRSPMDTNTELTTKPHFGKPTNYHVQRASCIATWPSPLTGGIIRQATILALLPSESNYILP